MTAAVSARQEISASPPPIAHDDIEGLRLLAKDARHITSEMNDEKYAVLRSPRQQGGRQLVLHFSFPKANKGVPRHYHTRFVETFVVLDGELQMQVGDERRQNFGPGSVIEVQPRTVHSFRNPNDQECSFVTFVEPQVEFENYIHAWFGLANSGQSDEHGQPKGLLVMATLVRWADTFFHGIPEPIFRIFVAVLTPIAKLCGTPRRLLRFTPEKN